MCRRFFIVWLSRRQCCRGCRFWRGVTLRVNLFTQLDPIDLNTDAAQCFIVNGLNIVILSVTTVILRRTSACFHFFPSQYIQDITPNSSRHSSLRPTRRALMQVSSPALPSRPPFPINLPSVWTVTEVVISVSSSSLACTEKAYVH